MLLRPRNQAVSVSALERRWNLDGRTCAKVATAGIASWSTARSDRTPPGLADATTIDDIDADRAARTPVTPIAQEARETFAGGTHEAERLVIQDATVHRGGR